jgi:hypothetical protein
MTNKILAAGSVALMGAGALVGATPAFAYTEAECGAAPAGGGINYEDGYCEVYFSDAGSHTWEVPSNASELWALLIGGGGGASGRVAYSEGYAGGGGDVQFFDLSDLEPGTAIDVFTGAGGASVDDSNDPGDDGEASEIETATDLWVADGGLGNSGGGIWGYCAPDGDYSTYVGQGPSYFDDELPVPSGGVCTSGTPGVLPLDDPDAPEIFSDIDWELGKGGDIITSGPGNSGEGFGADVFVNTETSEVGHEAYGEDGIVVFRWIPTGGLASTGVNTVPMGALAAGMLVAGGAGLAIARRARRSK